MPFIQHSCPSFNSHVPHSTPTSLTHQCCSALPAANATNEKQLCYYRDSGKSLVGTPMQSLMEGGEVAMWTDNYCPSPECTINGTYGWMYPKAMDKIFSESFGKMIFPKAAGAAGSLWNYVAALAPEGVPTDACTSALQHHVLCTSVAQPTGALREAVHLLTFSFKV